MVFNSESALTADKSKEANEIQPASKAEPDNTTLAAELWQGMKAGAKDELAYDRANPINSTVRAGLAMGAGGLLTETAEALKKNTRTQILAGLIISTGHFLHSDGHLDNVVDAAQERETRVERLGYVSGRFITDVGITAGLTVFSGRSKWEIARESSAAAIFKQDSVSYFVPVASKGWGVNRIEIAAHTQHHGLDLSTKEKTLAWFLQRRNETHLTSSLSNKFQFLHNPELAGKRWTTPYKSGL